MSERKKAIREGILEIGSLKMKVHVLEDGERVIEGRYVVEDAIFSYFGFGLGIFKPVTVDESQRFSVEPIKLENFYKKENFGFHKIDE